MHLRKNIKNQVNKVLERLPIRWRARIKRWRGLSLSPMEQLALTHLYSLIAEHQSDRTEVLFWRGPGRTSPLHTEAIVALALRLRGISTRFVICDGAMSGCIQRTFEDGKPISEWSKRCSKCFDPPFRVLDAYGIPYIGISELVSPERRAEFRGICDGLRAGDLASYEYRGVPVAQFAESSTLRYLKGQSLQGHEAILREYLYSALVCCEAAMSALNKLKPSRLFMQRHIEYVGWAPAYVVLTRAGLMTTLYSGGNLVDRSINLMKVVGTQWGLCGVLTDETWQQLSKQPLTEAGEEALDSYLSGDWGIGREAKDYSSNFEHYNMPHKSKETLLQELNINADKPIWCVFAHVTWDAGFSPENLVFRDVFDWTLATVQAMLETKQVTWLLKSHPGERRGTIRGVQEFVKDNFPGVGEHIRFIPADSEITTNDLCSVLSGAVTMHGTICVQLPARGIPVIVGERSHFSGKGFTCDGFTRERYLELVHQASEIPPLSDRERKLARRYAYFLFFQRRIPINMALGQTAYSPLDPAKIHLLFPGNDAVMDMICDRIINGGEFML